MKELQKLVIYTAVLYYGSVFLITFVVAFLREFGVDLDNPLNLPDERLENQRMMWWLAGSFLLACVLRLCRNWWKRKRIARAGESD
ncbi:MAG: hypothetical protein KDA74_18585 [Planctomycetaceae bacterium]|nr:hypothetical protein [Planctomycetaceae bacterium]MCA9117375.1 hypothetical protein [Planctomycetaceae bacterium]